MKPYYEHGGITIFHADNRELLSTLQGFNATITDIPYGISQKSGKLKGKELDFGEWDKFDDKDMGLFLKEVARITTGTAYISCSDLQISGILGYFKELDWLVRQLIWFKPGAFSMNGDKMYLWSTENIAYAKKRGATFNQEFKHNLFQYPTERNINRFHPTQKPISLVNEFIQDSTNQGDQILDPFMGSGTTLVSAKLLGRKATGIEIDEKYCEIAVRRLSQEVMF